MNIKCTLYKLIISLVLSPIIIYPIIYLAKFSGASYDFSHGETFAIWILMAILISQSIVFKKS